MPRRAPIKWPGNARIAVSLFVSWESWPDDLGTPTSHQRSNRGTLPTNAIFKKDLGVVMDRQYGEKAGIWRLLDLFKQEDVKATFFLNGKTVEENHEAAKEIVASGHEIAAQPYIHEYTITLDKDGEREVIRRSVEAFEKVLGVRPMGYLSPGVRPTPNTTEIIADQGFTWSSDCIDDDLPYYVNSKDRSILMMPKDFHPNDYTTYDVVSRSPRELLGLMQDQFDYLYEEGRNSPKMMSLSLHPFLAGRPYRTRVFQNFIRHARSHSEVWFARGIDIVEWWRHQYPAR